MSATIFRTVCSIFRTATFLYLGANFPLWSMRTAIGDIGIRRRLRRVERSRVVREETHARFFRGAKVELKQFLVERRFEQREHCEVGTRWLCLFSGYQ